MSDEKSKDKKPKDEKPPVAQEEAPENGDKDADDPPAGPPDTE